MGWPQITLIVLVAASCGLHLAKSGQPREDKYSFGMSLVSAAVIVGLTWAGGFWS